MALSDDETHAPRGADNINPAPEVRTESNERDVPTHLPYPALADDYFGKELSDIEEGRIFHNKDELDGYDVNNWTTTLFPGLRGLNQVSSSIDRGRIERCLQLGVEWRNNAQADEPYVIISSSFKRRPLIKRVLSMLEYTFLSLAVVQEDGVIMAIKPHAKRVQAFGRYLAEILEAYRGEFLANLLPIPKLPSWGRSNHIGEWWRPDEFEILATCYCKDAEDFIGSVAPFCVKGAEKQDLVFYPAAAPNTPKFKAPVLGSISEYQPRTIRFNTEAQSVGRNSAYLGAIISGAAPNKYSAKNRQSDAPSDSSDEDSNYLTPSSRYRNQRPTGFSHHAAAGGAPDPGDNGSNSDNSPSNRGFGSNRGRGSKRPLSRPPSRPDRSAYTAAANARGTGGLVPLSNRHTTYHFDPKLKPESVPQWDGDDDSLAKWMDKINSLSYHSEDIHRELGKIVPRRFTGLAETWYWSIPPAHRVDMEESWTTLKNAMHNYWMNSQWLERQKIRANLARFRESAHAHELPSTYVIRKLNLLRIVYDWSDTETIRLIMSEAPSSWSPILQPQFCNTIVEFQNAVKYHEENLVHASSTYNWNVQASPLNQDNTESNEGGNYEPVDTHNPTEASK